MSENMNTIKRNTEIILDASKEVDLIVEETHAGMQKLGSCTYLSSRSHSINTNTNSSKVLKHRKYRK